MCTYKDLNNQFVFGSIYIYININIDRSKVKYMFIYAIAPPPVLNKSTQIYFIMKRRLKKIR